MASENIINIYLNELKRLENKIFEIYYLGQFDIAKEYQERIKVLKEELRNLAYSPEYNELSKELSLNNPEYDVAFKIGELEDEIDSFITGDGKKIKESLNRERLIKQVNDVIAVLDVKSTQELWKDLTVINNKLEQDDFNSVDIREIKDEIAKCALEIMKTSIERDEEININVVDTLGVKENLVKAIRNDLINKAEEKDGNIKRVILDMAENLTVKDMNNPLVWRELANVENVKIAGVQEIKEIKQPIPVPPEKTFLGKIKQFFGFESIESEPKIHTIYTFADINPETGEWKNVRTERGEFPKEMSYDKMQKLVALEINGVEGIFKEHFRDDSGKVDVKFPNLVSIKFGNGVQYIGDSILSHNKHVEDIEIGTDVKKIGNHAFANTKLKKMIIPGNVEELGMGVCENCSSLVEVVIEAELTEIPSYAFKWTKITEMIIPKSVERIGIEAFEWCRELKKVHLNEGLKHIDNWAFKLTGLESIEVPEGVKRIGDQAFEKCEKLRKVIINEGVERLKYREFAFDDNIEILELPGSLKEVNDSVFSLDQEKIKRIVVSKELMGQFSRFKGARVIVREEKQSAPDNQIQNLALETLDINTDSSYIGETEDSMKKHERRIANESRTNC